jgi:hypothetical protein
MLNEMKSLKMMGLSEMMGDIVQEERVKETKRMEGFSWIKLWQNVVCKLAIQ